MNASPVRCPHKFTHTVRTAEGRAVVDLLTAEDLLDWLIERDSRAKSNLATFGGPACNDEAIHRLLAVVDQLVGVPTTPAEAVQMLDRAAQLDFSWDAVLDDVGADEPLPA